MKKQKITDSDIQNPRLFRAGRTSTRPGRCNSLEDLSPEVRSHLSDEAQRTFVERYNAVFDETQDELQAAWETIHQQYSEDEQGVWSKQKVAA